MRTTMMALAQKSSKLHRASLPVRSLALLLSIALVIGAGGAAFAAPVSGTNVLYTLDGEFDQGTLLNVNHDAPNNNQLQLNRTTTPFPFVNIAASSRGTKI